MVQVLDLGQSAGGRLGSAFGTGLSQGLDLLLENKMQGIQRRNKEVDRLRLLEEKKSGYEEMGFPGGLALLDPAAQRQYFSSQAPEKQTPPIELNDVVKTLHSIYNKEEIPQLGITDVEHYEDLIKKANEYAPSLGKDFAILQAINDQISPIEDIETAQQNRPLTENKPTKGEDNLASPFYDLLMPEDDTMASAYKKGLRGSISGRIPEIIAGQPIEEYERSIKLRNPSFRTRLAYAAGKTSGDLPYIAGGATLGGIAGSELGPGAIATSGAGAMALPQALETALNEFQQYQSRGYEGSFGDFVESVAKTGVAGVEGGIEGAMFGILSQAIPYLKNLSPTWKNLFESSKVGKIAEKGAQAVAQTAGVVGAKTAAKGELPETEEVIDTFTQVLGFNLAEGLPRVTGRGLIEKIRKSGVEPGKVAADVKAEIDTKGYDPKNKKDVARAITDVTKSYKGAEGEVATEAIETLQKTEAPKPKEVAEKLAERPIEETIESQRKKAEKKEKPLTEKEEAKRETAGEEAKRVEKEIKQAKEDVEAIDKSLKKKHNEKQRSTLTNARKLKNNELVELERRHEDLTSISKKGVEPFRPEKLEVSAQKHLSELEIASKNPESVPAKEWEHMFSRDQKYIAEHAKILQKGKLPDAPFKDRYQKTLEVYEKAYENQQKQLDSSVKEKQSQYDASNKRTKEGRQIKKDLNELKKHQDMLQRNLDINKAKIARQKDKVAQLYQLEKPGSSVTRQFLKGMRKDVAALQKDFIKQKKNLDAIEKKTEAIAKPKMDTVNKLVESYLKNPTESKLAQLEKQSGIPKEEVQTYKKKSKELAKDVAEKIEKGDNPNKIKDYIQKTITKWIKDTPKKLAGAVIGGILGNELQHLLQNVIGQKLPYTLLSFMMPGGYLTRVGAGSVGLYYESLKNERDIAAKKEVYNKIKAPRKRVEYTRNLKEEGYTRPQIKKITS